MDIAERLREWKNSPLFNWADLDPSDMEEAADEIERLREVLQSISNNTCCDNCQEAALVARAALKEKE